MQILQQLQQLNLNNPGESPISSGCGQWDRLGLS